MLLCRDEQHGSVGPAQVHAGIHSCYCVQAGRDVSKSELSANSTHIISFFLSIWFCELSKVLNYANIMIRGKKSLQTYLS